LPQNMKVATCTNSIFAYFCSTLEKGNSHQAFGNLLMTFSNDL